ncbi:MAG: hypothetical protein K2Y26_13365 [Gemmatimonadaceae bacterium]|nr:hypothetical protein [Gemmatimonadaceae bacterium]
MPNATASSTTTYEMFTAITRRPLGWALVACALGVLQACSGGDALAPEAVGSLPQSAPQTSNLAASQIHALSSDTVSVAGSQAILGSHLPTALGSLRIQVDGVDARVTAQSPTRVEWQLPVGSFACGAPQTRRLNVMGQGISFEAPVVVHTARRLSLSPGSPVVELSAADMSCIELAAPADGGYARYLLAAVNTGASTAELAPMALLGNGAASQTSMTPMPGALWGDAISSTSALSSEKEERAHAAAVERNAAVLRETAWPRRTVPVGAPDYSLQSRNALRAHSVARRVGDTLTLNVPVSGCALALPVKARVAYAGAKGIVLEDMNAPHVGQMNDTYASIGEEFDRVMFPLVLEHLGNPLALDRQLNADGRVTLLFTRVLNDSLPGTAGFVSACDLYPRSTFAYSNQDEVVYARVPSARETPQDWRRSMRATVVHETKHLASYAERLSRGHGFEEVWLEEATARVAEEIYARSFVRVGSPTGAPLSYEETLGCELRHCDDRPLVMFKHFSALHDYLRRVDVVPALGAAQPSAQQYASGWSFVRWVLDASNGDRQLLLQLVNGSAGRGLPALESLAGREASALVADWMTELAANLEGRATTHAATWNVAAVLKGLAADLPGAYMVRPLSASHTGFGPKTHPAKTVGPFAASLLVIEGPQSRAQLLSVDYRDISTGNSPAVLQSSGVRYRVVRVR